MVVDSALRAMTDDGAFRVVAVRTTDTARGVIDAQKLRGETARVMAELLTGTILVRETMAPALRVQGILQGAEKSGVLVADSWPDGGTRGLAQTPKARPGGVSLADGAVLQMMRTLPRGAVHQGLIAVPKEATVSEALMTYMQESEQVASMIAVGAVLDGDRIVAAGGYLVQLLPELKPELLMVMTERLKDFSAIDALLRDEATTPDTLVSELFYAMPHTRLADSPLAYRCRCDSVRLLATMATLPREDLQEMVDEGKALEIQCDYCGREYQIEPEQLRGLLAPS